MSVMSAVSGIQDQLLEIIVVACSKLKNTEWLSRQDPYVLLEYTNTKMEERTLPFRRSLPSPLLGLREINIHVWNSNTFTPDNFIGSGGVQLNKVLFQGYDDSPWPLQTKSGKYAGEVKLIMHVAITEKQQSKPCCCQGTQTYMQTMQAPPCIPCYFPSTSMADPQLPTFCAYPPANPSPYPLSMGTPYPMQQACPPQACQPPIYPPQQYYPSQAPQYHPPGPNRGAYFPPSH